MIPVGVAASQQPASAPAPSLSSAQTFKDTTNGTSFSWSRASASGEMLVRIVGRVNSDPFEEPAVSWGDGTWTRDAFEHEDGAGRMFVLVGRITGGTPGTNNLVLSSSKSFGNPVVQVEELSGQGSVGASAARQESGSAQGSMATPPSVTTTKTNALLVGCIGTTDPDAAPYSTPAGWTKDGEDDTGAGVDVAGAFYSRVVASSGSSVDLDPAADGSQTPADWAGAIVELAA